MSLPAEGASTVTDVFKRDQPITGFLARELPLAGLDSPPDDGATSAVAAVVRPDASWRLAETQTFKALGWMAGTTIAFTPTRAGYALRATGTRPTGASARMDARHRLMLPFAVREGLHLSVAQPLLLLGDPDTGQARLATLPSITRALLEAS